MQAGRGGSIFISSENGINLRMIDTALIYNKARQGGGLFFDIEGEESSFAFERVQFVGNAVVDAGSCVYQMYSESMTLFACANCTCSGDVATSVQTYYIQQYINNAWVEVTSLVSSSQEAMPVHRYIAVDVYGTIIKRFLIGSQSVTASTVASSDTEVQTYFVAGRTTETYIESAGAVFRNLVLAGTPGNFYNISWEPTEAAMGVELPVFLRECMFGEEYDIESMRCKECDSDRLIAPTGDLPAECRPCASDTHAMYACLINGTWYSDDLELCQTSSSSALRAMCVCDEGFYQISPDVDRDMVNHTCARCAEGAVCEYSVMRGLPGYWRLDASYDNFYECEPLDTCLGEIIIYGYDTNAMIQAYDATGRLEYLEWEELDQCRIGHSGAFCGACRDGWALQLSGYCEECGNSHIGVVLQSILLFLVCGTFLIVLLSLWLQRPFYRHEEEQAWLKMKASLREHKNSAVANVRNARKSVLSVTHAAIAGLSRSSIDKNDKQSTMPAIAADPDDEDNAQQLQDRRNVGGSGMDTRSTDDRTNSIDKVKVAWKVGRAEGHADRRAIREETSETSNMQNGCDHNEMGKADVQQLAQCLLCLCQILASFDSVFSIPWPEWYVKLLYRLNIFNFWFPSIPGLRCSFTGMDFLNRHAACVVIPFAVVHIVFALSIGSHYMQMKRNRTVDPVVYRFFIIRTIMFMLYVSYISISIEMFAFFQCDEVHDKLYLISDRNVRCWEGAHRRHIPLGVFGLICYPVGLPVVFICLLVTYRVPELARIKRHAALLHAAREILDPLCSAHYQDPLLTLELMTHEELVTLVLEADSRDMDVRYGRAISMDGRPRK
ncbi:hypothetical protein CYMTET_54775 [Cymbomonas tetramitiformis]|uniref:Transmembrane protein n=1 Tax=Cymbomonas tetramitiformis TaxID=36881 RepID=A0AAE0EP08_9CHLO|nr:hypothetical protein CYMTET_54775 [Cymbomonas tetramitiformis]